MRKILALGCRRPFIMIPHSKRLKMSSPATRKTVELFYDVVSPYTWFAFEVLCRYEQKWNLDVKLKPFFLGGIMKGAENTPPGMVRNKAIYMTKDLQLSSKYYDVPLKMPENVGAMMFVKGSLQAQRFITAVDMLDSSKTRAITREMWMRNWSRDEDITEPSSFMVAGKNAGLSDDQLQKCLQNMTDNTVKERLKSFTEEALNYRAFGSPTIVAHVESEKKPVMIFGSDRFPLLAFVLGEKWEGPTPDSAKSNM